MSTLTDLIDYGIPLRRLISSTNSLVDAFTFEILKSTILSNPSSIEKCIKNFKSEMFSLMCLFKNELEKYEMKIRGIDVFRKFERDEAEIKSLTVSIDSLHEKLEEVTKHFDEEKRKHENLKKEMKIIQKKLIEKDDDVEKMKNSVEEYKLMINNEKYLNSVTLENLTREKEVLNKTLKAKEKELNNSNQEVKILEKKIHKIKKDSVENLLLIKNAEKELNNNKNELRKYQTIEKIDQKNLKEAKLLLCEATDRVKSHEEQLRYDFDLINKMKDELVKLREEVQNVMTDKVEVERKFEDEEFARKNFEEKLVTLSKDFSEVDNLLIAMTEKNVKLKGRKKKIQLEFQLANNELEKLRKQHDEERTEMKVIREDHLKLKSQHNVLMEKFNQCQKQVSSLMTLKSISDEKVKLLTQFIQDFQSQEKHFQSRLIDESNQIRSRMDLMKSAFEKLF